MALFKTKSLGAVASSNHTCSVQLATHTYAREPCVEEALLGVLNCRSNPRDNRQWKVLSLLYATRGKGNGNEFKTIQTSKMIPEVLAFISDETTVDSDTPSTSDDASETHQVGCTADSESLFGEDSEDSDASSVESVQSFDSYDSILDELDDAFEDDEDEVYEDFDKSFTDSAFSSKRARLTVTFQVLKHWGLHLLDKSPPLPEPEVVEERKSKKMRNKLV